MELERDTEAQTVVHIGGDGDLETEGRLHEQHPCALRGHLNDSEVHLDARRRLCDLCDDSIW